MRSAVILAALAVGTCARVIHKEVYVTEWTTTTVTETITQWPNGPSSTTLVEHIAPTTKLVEAPAPTVDFSKKAPAAPVDPAPVDSASVPAAPAPTAAAAEVEPVQTSSATTSSTTSSATTSSVVTSSTSSAEPIQPVTSSATSSAAPVETSSAAPSSTASASGSYQESVLENHNIHRRVHSADDMTWSAELEDIARQIAEKCVYAHDVSVGNGIEYGQNIAYGVQEAQVGEKVISAMMYDNEEPLFEPYYGEADPSSSFESWGHFTQIVWKSTKQVGCYTYTCPSLGNTGATDSPFTVCNYSPPGNYGGEYADNVARPSS